MKFSCINTCNVNFKKVAFSHENLKYQEYQNLMWVALTGQEYI